MFKLIPNWKTIAIRAHSMMAFYFSLIALLTPEAVYYFFEIDTNPRIWFFVGIALLVYGIIGRIIDQGVDDA